MLTDQLVKAISSKLHQITDYPVYVDVVEQNTKLPCWIVKLLDATFTPLLDGRYWQQVTFNCTLYSDKKNLALQVLADNVAFQLEYVKYKDLLLKALDDVNFRITEDGFLSITVSYGQFVQRLNKTAPFMETLHLEKGEVKNG